MNKNRDISEILLHLSSLKFFDGKEEDFWQHYLEDVALLTKSPIAFVLQNHDDKWLMAQQYSDDSMKKEQLDTILNLSIGSSERAIKNLYGYERYKENLYIASIALETLDHLEVSTLVILIENSDKVEFSNSIVRAVLCRDIPLNYELLRDDRNNSTNQAVALVETDKENDEVVANSFEAIILLLNSIIYEENFSLACMNIVDEFSNRFNSHSVTLGWKKGDYVNVIAISQVDYFTKSSAKVKALEAVFEESFEQNEEIFYPEDSNTNLITHAHELYLGEHKLSAIYSFPIRFNDEVIGVMTFEKDKSELTYSELEVIRLALNYIAPILSKIEHHDMNPFKKLLYKMRKHTETFFGPKNTFIKLVGTLMSFVLLWVFFGTMMYKIEAVTNLQTDNILYISAPFDGVVKEVDVNVGDEVIKGEPLVSFETQELLLKKVEIGADIIRYATEAEKARANRKLADVKISLAKKKQSQSSLQKVDYYLSQAQIKAPFDGILIEGDKEKLLGSPFSKGDIILQIANPTHLYGKVKVLEAYIDEIKVGQIASLTLLSRPDLHFNVEVVKIIPMAKVDDVNGNVFTLKVKFLDDIEEWMHPGMSGIAKIEIAERSIFWILTHKISDYFYMHVWW